MEDEPKGRFTDQVFDHPARQDHACGRLHLHLDRDVMGLVPLEGQLHPSAGDRPVHHPGQKIADGPEKGDDFDLPDRPSHNFKNYQIHRMRTRKLFPNIRRDAFGVLNAIALQFYLNLRHLSALKALYAF